MKVSECTAVQNRCVQQASKMEQRLRQGRGNAMDVNGAAPICLAILGEAYVLQYMCLGVMTRTIHK